MLVRENPEDSEGSEISCSPPSSPSPSPSPPSRLSPVLPPDPSKPSSAPISETSPSPTPHAAMSPTLAPQDGKSKKDNIMSKCSYLDLDAKFASMLALNLA